MTRFRENVHLAKKHAYSYHVCINKFVKIKLIYTLKFIKQFFEAQKVEACFAPIFALKIKDSVMHVFPKKK